MKRERYLLKLSGESLKANDGFFDFKFAEEITKQIAEIIHNDEKEIVIVLGGGNICRGKDYLAKFSGKNARLSLDHAGMLGTIINGLYLKEVFKNIGIEAGLLSLLPISTEVTQAYSLDVAEKILVKRKVLILVGGIGISNFSTDLVAVVKSKELNIKHLLFGKIGIAGIYTADPKHNSNAELLKETTFLEVIRRKLTFMDLTAAAFSLENENILYVFNIKKPNSIVDIINQKGVYSVVKNK